MVKCLSKAISLTDKSIKSTVYAKHYSKFYHRFAHQLNIMHHSRWVGSVSSDHIL